MASKIVANLLVAGVGAFARAAARAYRQALVNAQRTGVAREAGEGVTARAVFGRRAMDAVEAREILGVDASASYARVRERFDALFERNARSGTFYLQSKVFRARERLMGEYDAEEVKIVDAEAEAAKAKAEAEAEAAKAEAEAGDDAAREGGRGGGRG
ncbi:Mitochondrial import inner membrane translocase subunit Tim16 [Ostreococcus tauri]|uniref:Mitochondrial import inner membrane translocase subunit Tim16 n=1 Tax=Ostreococcus tauri TaxID=70448 RepID=Q010B6_OSTTA|nr:Mitochondrial import inner membrane translocase subunit Tim16 [Ostreococcus tauri]CAL56116.1 Mitochondrial import inner membrane translocase subunit Tim16 [Ostreococcus tauri]|eukprot:XP_003081592.1 Mitochondrial import inner membrane translocase subunit Tim16 [Ostreococcus tauri]